MMVITQQRRDVPQPQLDAVNSAYFTAAQRHEFVLQQCELCESYVYFPRFNCPHCFSDTLVWKRASGVGSLHSFAIVWRPHDRGFDSDVPVVLAAVSLKEGPIVISELHHAAVDSLRIGMQVRVAWLDPEDAGSIPLAVWVPVLE